VKRTVAIAHASGATFEVHLAGTDLDLFADVPADDRRRPEQRPGRERPAGRAPAGEHAGDDYVTYAKAIIAGQD
jgi:hypothetical protein